MGCKATTRPARNFADKDTARRPSTRAHRNVLGGLAVVLQDDGDVHVDDDEEADDEVSEEVGDGHHGVAAVALVARLGVSWKRTWLVAGWDRLHGSI